MRFEQLLLLPLPPERAHTTECLRILLKMCPHTGVLLVYRGNVTDLCLQHLCLHYQLLLPLLPQRAQLQLLYAQSLLYFLMMPPLHARTHARMHARTHTHTHAYIHTHTKHTYTHTHTLAHRHRERDTHTDTHRHRQTDTHTHTHTFT